MPALGTGRNVRPARAKRRESSHDAMARLVANSLRSAGTYENQAAQIHRQATRQKRAAARRAVPVASTIPAVGNIVAAPRHSRTVLNQRKIDRAIRRAGRTGSPYPVGRASDLYLAPVARALARETRIAQRRGFGGARDYRAEHPEVYRRPTITAAEAIRLDPTIRTAGIGGRSSDLVRLAHQIGLPGASKIAEEREAQRMAPALKVLNQLQRGEYAVGGLIKGAKEGSVTEAIKNAYQGGITMEERYTPGQQIVGEGKGWLKGAARFALDVGLDPTTYVTLGGASVAAKTAAKAAIRAELQGARAAYKSALARGVSRGTARKIAKDAGRREGRKAFDLHMKAGEGRRGLSVSVLGGRTARRLAHRATPSRVSGRLARTRGGRTARERVAQERAAAAPLTRLTAGLAEAQSRGLRRAFGDTRVETTAAAARRVMGWHGGVRSPDIARSEIADLKAIKREARSAEEHGVRQSIARANLGRKLTDDEDDLIINAIERNRLSLIKDPDLRSIAKHYRDDFRYRFRRESRQGITAARTGQKSREEIRWEPGIQRHGQARRRLVKRHQEAERQVGNINRRLKELDDEATELQRRHVMAQEDPLNESSYITSHVPERYARRERAVQIGKEMSALEKQRAGLLRTQGKLRGAIRKEQHALGRAKSRHAQALAERKAKARGYFARVPEEQVQATKTLTQKLAEPLRPRREHITPSKPKPVASRYRKHTATREELKQGSETEQAAIARAHTKSGVSVAYRGISGSRGERAGYVNRQVAERFGEPVPKDFTKDTAEALRAQNKSVYKVQRGELHEVTDIDEIRRGARSALQEGERRAKRYQALKDEGLNPQEIREALKREPTQGRYVVLRDPLVAEARRGEKTWDTEAAGQLWDVANRGFKSLALATPQYLMRNFAGDMFNAWTEENALRLMRNSGRAQKALHQLGRKERGLAKGAKGEAKLDEVGKLKAAGRRFAGLLPNNKRWIKLTPEQAREIAGPSGDRLYNLLRKADPNISKEEIRAQIERNLSQGKIPAVHVAMLAEQMGVVRQGRFLELMQEGRREFGKGKGRSGVTPWQAAVKRVEDSTRLATFLGGLQRGMSPREAATRATRLHFDYGDLSTIERNALRRLMPFYTFPSRNIPLQAQQVLRRPGKYATVEKAREELATQAGLDRDRYQSNLPEFEARQLPFPVKVGGKTYTLSMAQPFTDLNDVTAFGETFTGGNKGRDILNVGKIPSKRILESLGPFKTPLLELPLNKSLYFREDIAPDWARLTRAPGWAKWFKDVPGFQEVTGYQRYKGKGGRERGPAMWDKRTEFALRSMLPGILGAATEAGQKLTGTGAEKNWRGRTPGQKALNFWTGIRSTTYDEPKARERGDAARERQLTQLTQDHRQMAREAGITDPDKWKTPQYKAWLKELRQIDRRQEARVGTKSEDEGPPLTGAAALRAQRRTSSRRSDTSGAAALRIARANR